MVESGGGAVGGRWSSQSFLLLGARPLQTSPSALDGLPWSNCQWLYAPGVAARYAAATS